MSGPLKWRKKVTLISDEDFASALERLDRRLKGKEREMKNDQIDSARIVCLEITPGELESLKAMIKSMPKGQLGLTVPDVGNVFVDEELPDEGGHYTLGCHDNLDQPIILNLSINVTN